MNRMIKYLLFIIGLPAIGFLTMDIVRPATSGAHDGGFLGMVLGLIIAQVIFAIWLLEVRWYFSFFIGLIIGIATVMLSLWLLWELRDIYYPDGNPYDIRHDDELERKIQGIFFLILVPASVLVFEIVFLLTKRFNRNRNQEILSER